MGKLIGHCFVGGMMILLNTTFAGCSQPGEGRDEDKGQRKIPERSAAVSGGAGQSLPKETDHFEESPVPEKKSESRLIGDLRSSSGIAIREKWSMTDWIGRFGEPNSKNVYSEGVQIRYYESDDYYQTDDSYIFGLSVYLEDDETTSYDWIIMRNE